MANRVATPEREPWLGELSVSLVAFSPPRCGPQSRRRWRGLRPPQPTGGKVVPQAPARLNVISGLLDPELFQAVLKCAERHSQQLRRASNIPVGAPERLQDFGLFVLLPGILRDDRAKGASER